MAIALGGVMAVLESVLVAVKLTAVRDLPVIGGHLEVGVAILMVWVLDLHLVEAFTGQMNQAWMGIVIDGVVIFGMIPVKDAVVAAIGKGLRS